MGCPAMRSDDLTGKPAIVAQPIAACPAALIPTDFQIQPVDHKFMACPALEAAAPSTRPDAPSIIDILPTLNGHFHGPGFNNIFRPRNISGPLNTQMSLNDDNRKTNVLELNLTKEHWVFTPVTDVANRGLGNQTDICLNGVSYLQRVFDVGDATTGQRLPGGGSLIHLEPGLIMVVPAATFNPVIGTTISRMASIPHGTTINLQGLPPTENDPSTVKTAPSFSDASMKPFNTKTGVPVAPFTNQTAVTENTPRLPQDLNPFINAGTITQDTLDNPNLVLSQANKGKNITSSFAFKLSSNPLPDQLGGGTTNIAFLQGAPNPTAAPNADAANVSVTFWFSTVVYEVDLKPFTPTANDKIMELRPNGVSNSVPEDGSFPVFQVDFEVTEAKTISVSVPQIQYSQTVLLNFATLSWPHVSVATLLPVRSAIPPQ